MKKCKLCKTNTNVGFNINFKLVPVCEDCAASIFLQQAKYYVHDLPKIKDVTK